MPQIFCRITKANPFFYRNENNFILRNGYEREMEPHKFKYAGSMVKVIKLIYFYLQAHTHTNNMFFFFFISKLENIRPLRTIDDNPMCGRAGRSGRHRDRYMKVTGLLRFDIVVNPIVWVTSEHSETRNIRYRPNHFLV